MFFVLLFRWSKKFKVSHLYIADPVLILGNHTQIFWKCQGVYKIKVKHIGRFPGNKNYLTIPLRKREIRVEITFYGILKKVTKTITLIPQEVNVVQQEFLYRPNKNIKSLSPKLHNFKIGIPMNGNTTLLGISSSFKVGLASKIKFNPFNLKYFKQLYYGK